MERKSNISDYRSKLEKTLASPDLINVEMIHTLVKNQILQSSASHLEEYTEYVLKRRSKEVCNFLSMLRSASANVIERSKSSDESHSGWKVKEDTEEFRVMYREGPEGTPYHTLLVEGYVDGPVDVCLCISCESDLYKNWWPQTAIPAFKVISSQCLQRVRIGEQISIVRMNSWPLSIREALIHYFTFEYFQDGLIVVLLNSISDSETIDRSTHGFTRDGLPDADDVVRINVVGGFAIQKVTSERSYFRTIANMDIKLDFAPPSFINFISRQLIGSGFKLYKKEVACVTKGDEKFLEALKDPMYIRIREALYSEDTYTTSPVLESSITLEEQNIEALEYNSAKENNVGFRDSEVPDEIEEFEGQDIEGSESLDYNTHNSCDNLTNEITVNFGSEIEKKVCISPKVQKALGTLEKAIFILREYNSTCGKGHESDAKKGNSINLEDDGEKSISSETDLMRRNNGNCGESSRIEPTESAPCELRSSSPSHGSRHIESNSCAKEATQGKIAPVSPDKDSSSPSQVKHVDVNSSINQRIGTTVVENNTESHSISADGNISSGTKRRNKKSMLCCFHFVSG
ncbi:hypothetical protein BUALT_Bualt09G0106200 [Buddleja alternifolia]|uniref:START domain-containing protein n=1 Tax=Buddleja alternifolia TaxID=168488 RepID=A0AAV6XCE7_9LAMI|nr:hypothetical protein BUALT_Bualt09G0106200 [Buddleja alternifolia]